MKSKSATQQLQKYFWSNTCIILNSSACFSSLYHVLDILGKQSSSGCSDHLSCKNICKLDVLMSMYDSTTFLSRCTYHTHYWFFFHLLLFLITVQWPLACVYLYTKLEQRFVKSTRSWNGTLHFILINKGQCMVYPTAPPHVTSVCSFSTFTFALSACNLFLCAVTRLSYPLSLSGLSRGI